MERQNFLIVVADQLRADALQAFNPSSPVSTRNLDKLASAGVGFSQVTALRARSRGVNMPCRRALRPLIRKNTCDSIIDFPMIFRFSQQLVISAYLFGRWRRGWGGGRAFGQSPMELLQLQIVGAHQHCAAPKVAVRNR